MIDLSLEESDVLAVRLTRPLSENNWGQFMSYHELPPLLWRLFHGQSQPYQTLKL